MYDTFDLMRAATAAYSPSVIYASHMI